MVKDVRPHPADRQEPSAQTLFIPDHTRVVAPDPTLGGEGSHDPKDHDANWQRPPFIHKHVLPTPYEREMLLNTIEECAEVSQRVTKLLRFGALEAQTGHPNNTVRLGLEIGNLVEMIDVICKLGLVTADDIEIGRQEKRAKLPIYTRETPP